MLFVCFKCIVLVLALKLVAGISLNAYRDAQGPANAG